MPVMIKFSLDEIVLEPNTIYKFTINTYGECDKVGAEFNPLNEVDKYGRSNPFQDPSRGRIANKTTDVNGMIEEVIDRDILQNLAGYHSLIGRSISFFKEDSEDEDSDDDDDDDEVGCCAIVLERPPSTTPAPAAPVPHHHSSHGRYPY